MERGDGRHTGRRTVLHGTVLDSFNFEADLEAFEPIKKNGRRYLGRRSSFEEPLRSVDGPGRRIVPSFLRNEPFAEQNSTSGQHP